MSIRAIDWVIKHADSRGGEYTVMLMIANHLGPSGEPAFPSIATLAQEARLSRQQTITVLRKLESKNAITITRGGGRARRSCYRLPGFDASATTCKGKTDTMELFMDLENVNRPDQLAPEMVKQVDCFGPTNGQICGPKSLVCPSETVRPHVRKGQVCRSVYKAEPSIEPLQETVTNRQSRIWCDDAFLEQLQSSEGYRMLNVRLSYARMLEWCELHKVKATKRRLLNWLNREDLSRNNGSNQQNTSAPAGKRVGVFQFKPKGVIG